VSMAAALKSLRRANPAQAIKNTNRSGLLGKLIG